MFLTFAAVLILGGVLLSLVLVGLALRTSSNNPTPSKLTDEEAQAINHEQGRLW